MRYSRKKLLSMLMLGAMGISMMSTVAPLIGNAGRKGVICNQDAVTGAVYRIEVEEGQVYNDGVNVYKVFMNEEGEPYLAPLNYQMSVNKFGKCIQAAPQFPVNGLRTCTQLVPQMPVNVIGTCTQVAPQMPINIFEMPTNYVYVQKNFIINSPQNQEKDPNMLPFNIMNKVLRKMDKKESKDEKKEFNYEKEEDKCKNPKKPPLTRTEKRKRYLINLKKKFDILPDMVEKIDMAISNSDVKLFWFGEDNFAKLCVKKGREDRQAVKDMQAAKDINMADNEIRQLSDGEKKKYIDNLYEKFKKSSKGERIDMAINNLNVRLIWFGGDQASREIVKAGRRANEEAAKKEAKEIKKTEKEN